jgi:outer membrane protein assembly factor BamE (lipoprotein component of BamABCDE complex)
MKKFPWLNAVLGGAVLLVVTGGCMQHPVAAGPDASANNLTVGKVQSQITVGLSGAEVAEILGSPNIVSTDEKRREVWIYDKVSSSRVDTANSFAGGLIIVGGSTEKAQRTTSQKTLTIVIKFDEMKKVRDFAYNYSQF